MMIFWKHGEPIMINGLNDNAADIILHISIKRQNISTH